MPGVHAESARRDDQVRRIACQEDSVRAIPIRKHELLLPLTDIERFVVNGKTDDLLKQPGHFLVRLHGCMKRKVLLVILDDEERRFVIGDVVVPAYANGDPVEQVVALEEGLAHPQQGLAREVDAQQASNRARGSVASDQEFQKCVRRRPPPS